MKKTFLTLVAFILFSINSFAQEAKMGTVEINKIAQPCVMADYSLPMEILEGALKQKMTEAKLGKGESTKDGFKLYKGILIPEISTEKIDVYFKITGDKEKSAIYMLSSKGYDNFMKTDVDAEVFAKSMVFINNFANDANAFLLNKQIVSENEIMQDNEKNLKNEIKDEASFRKDGTKVDSKIAQATNGIEAYKKEIEIQQKALDVIKAKTATLEGMKALKKETDKQESIVKKATKNYENAVNDEKDYRNDLQKIESKINESKTKQEMIKGKIADNMKKLTELKTSLNSIKK